MDTDPTQMQLVSRYALLVFIWSTTPLAVVLSIQELHPIWALSLRFALAVPLAMVCLWAIGQTLPLNTQALRSYCAGALSLFGAMIFTYLGASYLPSSLISLLFGLSPLMVGLLAHCVFKTQALRVEQWFGLCVAFVGLLTIFSHTGHASAQARGIILILLGVSCYVVSVFWLKHENAGLHPLAQTTGSLVLSSVGMGFVLPFYWDVMPTHMPSWVSLSALLYSVVIATLVAMFCYFYLVKQLAPATVSLTTFITPSFALLWGFWLNGERFNGFTVLGMSAIFVGMLMYFLREILSILMFKCRAYA